MYTSVLPVGTISTTYFFHKYFTPKTELNEIKTAENAPALQITLYHNTIRDTLSISS